MFVSVGRWGEKGGKKPGGREGAGKTWNMPRAVGWGVSQRAGWVSVAAVAILFVLCLYISTVYQSDI